MSGVKEVLYLGKYSSLEELEKELEFYWSGSRFDTYLQCLRKGQYQYEERLEKKDEERIDRIAGSALHAALSAYYSWGGKEGGEQAEEQTKIALKASLETDGGLPIQPPDSKKAHITTGHLQLIVKNYFKWAKLHDSIKPIVATEEDINWSLVAGAKLRVNDEGKILMGESAFIMPFEVKVPWRDEPETYYYAGKPDLPVIMGGSAYVMDHKSTNMPLSAWFFKRFTLDNTLRVYAIMQRALLKKLGIKTRGILINGIWMAKGATNPASKGTKFARYGPIDFDEGALQEALLNHASIIEMRRNIEENMGGYYPQSPGLYCNNCAFLDLCKVDPMLRPAIKAAKYRERPKHHLLRLDEDNDEGKTDSG